MSQRIRIKLKSYDFNLVDKSAEKIVKTVRSTGAVVSGPIPLPTEKEKFTVLRSPHVNKKSREQFEIKSYNKLLILNYNSNINNDLLNFRNIKITSNDINKTFKVHNGKSLIEVNLNSKNVGKKLGVFAPTKIFKAHKKKKNNLNKIN